jgi:hypothetical protein
MHSVQTIGNSKFYCHVYSFLHVVCYTSKTLVLQEGHCGDDRFFWSVAKINFVCFFCCGWFIKELDCVIKGVVVILLF